MRRALFIASFDSQLKWCTRVLEAFEREGYVCRTVVPGVRSALSAEQIAAAGFERVERKSWEETVSLALSHDVVVSSLSGPMTRRLTFQVSASDLPGPRPVLVSGWVGIIIEKLTAGYLDRIGCDVVAVNSKEDGARFEDAAATLDVPTENLMLTGLPFLPGKPEPMRGGPIQRVLFADQPTVPANREERLFVYEEMIAYAAKHPDREVILKPRHKPDEDTFHKMQFSPETLLEGHAFPTNFRIDYTPISEMVGHIDLLVTMSSTASLEALAAGTRVAYPLDLGVHERYGNQVFEKTGLLRTFAQISDDDIGTPSEGFIDAYFFEKPAASFDMIEQRCTELLDRDERPAAKVWETGYFKAARAAEFKVMDLRERMKKTKSMETGGATGLVIRRVGAVVKPILPRRVAGSLWRLARRWQIIN